jgi:hypothetical protein
MKPKEIEMAKFHYLRVTDPEFTDGEYFDVGFMPLSDKKTVCVKRIPHDPTGGEFWEQVSIEKAREAYAFYRSIFAQKIENPIR